MADGERHMFSRAGKEGDLGEHLSTVACKGAPHAHLDEEGEGLGLTELRDGLDAWQRAVGHVRGAKRGREDQPAFLTWNGHLFRLEPRLRLLGFGPQHEPAVVTVWIALESSVVGR